MPRFISISQKILMLILLLLLVTVSVLTVMMINESDKELKKYQIKHIDSKHSDYNVIFDMITTNAVLWGENVIAQYHQQTSPINAIQAHITRQLSYLRLNEQIDNVWLLDEQQQILFSSMADPLVEPQISRMIGSVNDSENEPRRLINKGDAFLPDFVVQNKQTSGYINQIYCQESCVHLIRLPIMFQGKQSGYMVFTIPLTQLLANVYQTTEAELGIGYPPQSLLAYQFTLQPTTLTSKVASLTPLFSDIDEQVQMDTVVEQGVRVTKNERSYLVTAVLLNPQQSPPQHQYLMIVNEISDFFNAAERFTSGAIVTAVLLFIGFASIFLLVTHSYKIRLANLVERFPLINQHQYSEFKDKRIQRGKGFRDELDILDEAAELLADELSVLDEALQQDRLALEKIAMYDSLTNLPNRNMLNDHLRRVIAKYQRNKDGFCVMLLDIDDFKKINDGQGHNIGDKLLRLVAAAVQDQVRTEDLVCRFGGDEFVIVLSGIETVDSALIVWNKLKHKIAEPVVIDGAQFFISVSVGLSMCDEQDPSGEELIRRADTAMYRAKEKSGSAMRIYDEALNNEVQRKIELEREAHIALENGDFYLALQPIIDLSTQFLTGFEALLRWRHPQKGLISPGEFIPILEKSIFMLKLDYWVIERSIQVLKMLDGQGYTQQTISINLSSAQFLDPLLYDFLQQMFTKYQIKPSRIDLELTETTLVSDIHVTTKIMRELRGLGVRISIDDFGTGYSSLSYLKSMPVNTIKIDRSFINGIIDSPADKQIVMSTISMVHNMGMSVVAEGIEDIKQYNMLRGMKCDRAQGFFIAKPIPEHQLMKTLPTIILDNVWQSSYGQSNKLQHF